MVKGGSRKHQDPTRIETHQGVLWSSSVSFYQGVCTAGLQGLWSRRSNKQAAVWTSLSWAMRRFSQERNTGFNMKERSPDVLSTSSSGSLKGAESGLVAAGTFPQQLAASFRIDLSDGNLEMFFIPGDQAVGFGSRHLSTFVCKGGSPNKTYPVRGPFERGLGTPQIDPILEESSFGRGPHFGTM